MENRFGKVLMPDENGEYDPEQIDVMERLMAMYRPQYVPPQFAQPMTQIQPAMQISPMPYGFPSTTANVQVMPPGYGFPSTTANVQVMPPGYGYLTPRETEMRSAMGMIRPFPAPLPPPPPSGRIMVEESPEE